jgi:glycosyltransferase involved in cell wall biosynthesis
VLLMVRQLGWGGTERQLTELAKALDRRRFLPHVAAFYTDGPRARELEASGVPVIEIPVRSLFRPVPAARVLRAYLREHAIRLVHTFDHPANIFGVPAAKLAGGCTVLASQRGHRWNYSRKYRLMLRISDRLADGIVVNCEAIRRHLMKEYSVPERKIRLCYNGIDPRVFHPGPRERPAALADAAAVIGTVAVLRPEKGLPVLLEAFARLAAGRKGLRLAIVGSGPVETELRERAAALGLRDSCLFVPATAEVPRWLRAFDIFVQPSLNEALSNSLMEAMACGCCAVASNVGGNPELVTGGETGMLFERANAGELAERLAWLIDRPELRAQLGKCAAARIAARFSLQASVERIEEIYAEHLACR